VQNAWHVSYGYVHHSFKAKHALLQEIDAHTLLQHVIDALEGLEAQAQKSAVGADEDTAKLQHVIDTLVQKRRPAERIDSLRAELVEAKQFAADKEVEQQMSKTYDVILSGLSTYVQGTHPYAVGKWPAAESSAGGHATPHA